MAIQFFTDKIKIGDFTLFEGNGGLQFDGVARAENFKTFSFQGTVAGFVSGGRTVTAPTTNFNTIDKFPFAADTDATDVGDLSRLVARGAGCSSSVAGYVAGGYGPPGAAVNSIDKFVFSTSIAGTDTTDLTAPAAEMAGQSSSTHGYRSGGFPPFPPGSNVIDKFPFATNTNATDVGDLTQGRYSTAGHSSDISGYTSGGLAGPGVLNTIDKFPFATDTNATDVGDVLVSPLTGAASHSSTTHGYRAGGGASAPPSSVANTISKFPFAADTNTTIVGDLFTNRAIIYSGSSSTTSGYSSGGYNPGPTASNTIEKFSFATDSNGTDVGNLSVARFGVHGQQD